ncbi:acetoacetate decarboxylase family protein [Planosporangium thailandense]|uniref:Acetoacetate decarboxylase family protein n=2 Tax=Planosporangium thailandense TaxID=765197 RepID=A0ABX0Y127_9ACTN|nr:acetoacetate decarboxylase family protein [Planosporangium thailandense]NJC72051.1 acetoacetate decarboxylase family protein [Planosporangium thailandense]
MYVSVWLVPRARLPRLPAGLAAAVRPVTIGGHGIIGTAWVEYGPGGVLQYRELLSAVLVRDRARPRVSIVDIWVDSPASRAGGRQLWGIPKELAELEFSPDAADGGDGLTARAGTGEGVIAQARISTGPRRLGRWPAGASVVQLLGDRVTVTPVRGRASIRAAHAAWRVPAGAPLAYLRDRRPLFTVALRDFDILFGRRSAPR